jgi:hypothetical protein
MTEFTVNTVEDVKRIVEEIRLMKRDDEKAHIYEDELYEAVLICISQENFNLLEARLMAEEALKTKDIDFSRWCA